MRPLLHRCIELELKTAGVGELQGAALKRLLGEGVSYTVFGKERRGLVEVLLVADLESHAVASRRYRFAQHHRMMLMLLAAAQIDRFVVAILDMQPDGVLVKFAAGIEVDHVEHDMAAADDVERRIEDVLRCGHRVFPRKNSSSSTPLPLGEVGAKRRVRGYA